MIHDHDQSRDTIIIDVKNPKSVQYLGWSIELALITVEMDPKTC